ncbi:MAG: NAD(P)/FAD-dependent oxidoreductase [Candidatus Lokiarchaeota archaeon]|nr:NAD(P)/FAD-dependent oxidoreductase [Candidatus Lokiarchaeota archaeon]
MKKDIVIIGGGASGAMAAWLAAERGLAVSLIEAKERGAYHPCSGVYPLHSFKGFPPLPGSAFERDMVTMRPMSPASAFVLDGREFGTSLGKIILRSTFDKCMLDAAEKKGADILDGTRAKGIEVTGDGVAVTCVAAGRPESTIRGDVLFLATGTSGFHLHDQLGIEKPPVVQSIICEYECSERHVEEVLSAGAYHYYVNKRVTSIGPFWITCRRDSFNAGIIDHHVSWERYKETVEKDPRVKDLFAGAREKVWPGQKSPRVMTLIPRAPVKRPHANRVLLLGDAAGLAHPFYYEGVWQGRLSAKHAVETMVRLRDENKAPIAENLAGYKALLARTLVNKFNRSGRKNSWLFWEATSDESLWTFFINALAENKELRALIVKCFELDYAETTDDVDFKAGEMIFQTIPTLKKILFAPHFLRAGTIR